MGRLIDTDVLKIRLYHNKETVINNALVKCIDETPTAFDVETVVAELEEINNKYVHHSIHGAYQRGVIDGAILAYQTAISIVRNGGKE